MLVLARQVGESVRITVGDVRVWVKVTDIVRDKIVKLGIEAPRCVNVLRSELIAKYDPPQEDAT